MRYELQLPSGQHLELENEGEDTLISIGTRDEGQQQRQSTGFQMGKWSSAPKVYRSSDGAIVRINTYEGPRFIRVRGSQLRSLAEAPDVEESEELPLQEAKQGRSGGMSMKPMRPMEPMKPMAPMQPMRPMEMQMGGMRMSMGGGQEGSSTDRRFCTQCGKPVSREDRFCGSCGAKLKTAE